MKVLNIHHRIIEQPKASVAKLLDTLATKGDKVWLQEKWPAMRFKDGLIEGAKGGHGPIRYFIKKIVPNESIEFQFTKPTGLFGIHRLELKGLGVDRTEIKHTIDVQTNFVGTLQWISFIRVLHDALIEDAFDKVENHFSPHKKKTAWSWWVRFLRLILK